MEKLTFKANQRPKDEWETFGQAVKEISIAILMVGVLWVLGNVVLGLN